MSFEVLNHFLYGFEVGALMTCLHSFSLYPLYIQVLPICTRDIIWSNSALMTPSQAVNIYIYPVIIALNNQFKSNGSQK